MLHWMLLTLSTLMPSLEANIVGGVQTDRSNPHDASDVHHASVQTASQMDSTRELAADGAPHHCAPAAAGRGAPHP